jgi:hypothetical protein
MKIKAKENREIEVITDIICDSCGKSCKTDVDYEYMTLEANWGYGTENDLEKWSAHIYEDCVDEKLSFIKFKKSNINFQTVFDNYYLKYPKNENGDQRTE